MPGKESIKSLNKLWLVAAAILCAVLIVVLSREQVVVKAGSASGGSGCQAETIFKYKTPYVGDNGMVVNLIDSLPYAGFRKTVSLHTEARPYAVTVQYDFSGGVGPERDTLLNNAVVMMAMVGNLDEVDFVVDTGQAEDNYQYTREQLQRMYPQNLSEYSQDVKALTRLINSFQLRLFSRPQRYSPAMSSTPGIRVTAQYSGSADEIEYLASSGQFLCWNFTSGKIISYGYNVKSPVSTSYYWSPLPDAGLEDGRDITIKASVLKNNAVVAEKQLLLSFDAGSGCYTVVQIPPARSLDEAVSRAVKDQSVGYAFGESATEGHIILDSDEKDGITTAYTVSSYGAYGFENGVFTSVSGSGAIPTVMTFARDKAGGYALLEYKEPEDGENNLQSTKELFPERLWARVLSDENYYPALKKQKMEQARQYLQSINRKAGVSEDYVEKELPRIDVQASNELFCGSIKSAPELDKFPYWLGTTEYLVDGVRYIYETAQSKSSDGYDLITFKKSKEDGTVVMEYQYKIVGSQPQLIMHTVTPD